MRRKIIKIHRRIKKRRMKGLRWALAIMLLAISFITKDPLVARALKDIL